MTPTRYPLQWPVGWKRTPDHRRVRGGFGVRQQTGGRSYATLEDITMAKAVRRLLDELGRMAVRESGIVISTDVRLRLDGLPYSGERAPRDPGAAVYWKDPFNGKDRAMAIDLYTKVEQNIAALAATIEAMRAIERHGGAAVIERAFTGFTALPAPIVAGMKRPWRDVLGFQPGSLSGAGTGRNGSVTAADVQQRYRTLAMNHHPDRGGDPAKMAELNTARDEALQELGNG